MPGRAKHYVPFANPTIKEGLAQGSRKVVTKAGKTIDLTVAHECVNRDGEKNPEKKRAAN